jgi:hypothetical protein
MFSATFVCKIYEERSDILQIYIRLHVKYPLILSGVNENLNFLDRYLKKSSSTKFH